MNSPDIRPESHHRILIVDDHLTARQLYASYLRSLFDVTIVSSGEEALDLAKSQAFDLYITDLMMPGMDGVSFIKKLRNIYPDAGVIVSSQTEEIDMAIAAFRQKPLEFLRKPIKKNLLINAIERNLEVKNLRENMTILNTLTGTDPGCPEPVLGESDVMREFWARVKKVADAEIACAVLITGESGCGKEVVARQLHRWSRRGNHPFIAVNCGLLTTDLAASELMGVNRGVATGVEPRKGKFVVAHQGVVFLDEIAELPSQVQPMLLRVLQERVVTPLGSAQEIPVDVLLVAATNKNLGKSVSQGLFREDLFYRISMLTLEIPPLRDRLEDIPALLEHLYRRHGGKGSVPLDVSELRQWMRYSWPGNIRQLENALINRIITGKPIHPDTSAVQHNRLEKGTLNLNDQMTWEEIRSTVFQHAIQQADGNIREAARKLSIPKSTLWEYHQKFSKQS